VIGDVARPTAIFRPDMLQEEDESDYDPCERGMEVSCLEDSQLQSQALENLLAPRPMQGPSRATPFVDIEGVRLSTMGALVAAGVVTAVHSDFGGTCRGLRGEGAMGFAT